jgi:A/G-specific adenine glycosylase
MNNTGLMQAAEKRRLRTAVLGWYERNGRRLPWRESADPYRIWLSEIMLQQTTVAAVVPYFERFVARFPDVQSLAAAPVDDVLKLWEGLGYYSRARNLHKAAQALVADFAGRFPEDVVALQSLPGIGRYTAGAIASFAFDQPAAIVEANTERLYARLLALREDVRSTASQKILWQFAEELVSSQRPGDFNQALMDIGSKICRPQDPDCAQCPLTSACGTFKGGLQEQVPVRKARTSITAVNELGVILTSGERFLLRRRTQSERWAGMWDFVRFEIDESEVLRLPFTQMHRESRRPHESVAAKTNASPAKSRHKSKSLFSATGDRLPESFQERIRQQSNCEARRVLASMEFSYTVTRYKVRLLCFVCESSDIAPESGDERAWFTLANIGSLPLSATGRRIADWLNGQRLP